MNRVPEAATIARRPVRPRVEPAAELPPAAVAEFHFVVGSVAAS